VLEPDLCILDPDLMLIGRQVQTEYGRNIDLLTLDVQETLGTGGRRTGSNGLGPTE
jgi:hypothetical protein